MLPKPLHCTTCVLGCPPFGKPNGFVPQASPTGAGNGVLVVLEAAGADEEQAGLPTIGAAGHFLWSQLARVDLKREDFRIHNVLSCRPPGNVLAGAPYEQQAIAHCSGFLDETIATHRAACSAAGQTPTILALGKIAFKRIMGYDDKHPIMRKDYQCYPHWSDKYGVWVIAGDHPSFLMRGNNHRLPILLFAVQRAVEIAKDGLTLLDEAYLEDPNGPTFAGWENEYERVWNLNPAETFLAYDIETPMKQRVDDEEEVSKEADDDYTILRISFAYNDAADRVHTVSVPWDTEHMPYIERIFSLSNQLIGWNLAYDSPRVRYSGINIRGLEIDAMLAWHVLNTSMPKGLGFVTPFYVKNTLMWKHMNDTRPAFYNAKDSAMTLHDWLGIRNDLRRNNLYDVFERHVMRLNEALAYMSQVGVPFDHAARSEAEKTLQISLDDIDRRIQGSVPLDARELKVYKKDPKDLTDIIDRYIQVDDTRIAKQCLQCGTLDVKADHFKSVGVKRLKAGEPENPCHGSKAEKVEIDAKLWALPLPFKLSKTSLERYQKVRGHQPIINRKEGRVTFDENSIKSLRKKYPKDPLYPLIGDFRSTQKLLTTYVGVTDPATGRVRGGMPIGPDGRVHTTFSHNPSTLRLASQNPNLQNIPRSASNDISIRNMFAAGPGLTFLARDFSGIEAVLVGYEAKAPNYIRLAKRDVHSFYTAYALNELDGRISGNDLPQLSWDDERLFSRLAEIKKEFKSDRNNLYKHLVHAINFGQGAKGAQEKIYKETDIIFDVKLIQRVMDLYKELFPEIPKWQSAVRLQADKDGYLRNAFGYVHRFNRVFSWKKDHNGLWRKEAGDDAEAVLAFKPQSNAAGIIKEAAMRIYFDRFPEAGQYLRLLIHDEIFCEPPEDQVEAVDRVLQEEMERPISVMPLPASWGMGTHLVVNTEAKSGSRWGKMK